MIITTTETIPNKEITEAASVFHFNEIRLKDLKTELKNNNIPIRL